MILLFTLLTSACLVGLMVWKASAARAAALGRAETEIHNLAHSLAEHAANTFTAVDVATVGMVDLLRYQNPLPDRFNAFLRSTVRSLPQITEIAVLDRDGAFLYASADEARRYTNADRDYFLFHRDNTDNAMRVTGPLLSRLLQQQVIVLSRRITRPDGSFAGVVFATIDCDFFDRFYKTFRLGSRGGISLIAPDGKLLSNSFSKEIGRDFSGSELFKSKLPASNVGYYKLVSPIDGVTKYFGYERSPGYGTVSTVALPEGELLVGWRQDLLSDLVVVAALLCIVSFLGIVLAAQFRQRAKAEQGLRDSEHLYRLLTDNIADIVILLDRRGHFLFVSQSVAAVLGWNAEHLVGTSCFAMVHPDDCDLVRAATAQLIATNETQTIRFRTFRADGATRWAEVVFKLAADTLKEDDLEMVGVLRDITDSKAMEDELTELNARLSELARTDGLTGLANRRSLDGFLLRCFAEAGDLSVLMIDIDHFKAFNDWFGHQSGDDCLKRVSEVIASATHGDNHFAARYGGEEFAVVLSGANEQRAFLVAESLRLQVKALGIGHPAAPQKILSVSIGVGSRTPSMPSESALIENADMALYQAKRSGRDRIVTASQLAPAFVEATLVPRQADSPGQAASRSSSRAE